MKPDHGSCISIVVPVHSEGDVIEAFHRRLAVVMDSVDMEWEVIYVNDGSRDDTLDRISRLREGDPRIGIVDLSRNFGKEIAMTAGLDWAAGDAVVVIDADLQDPPELIPEMMARWREGYDVVYATRLDREGESVAKRLTAFLFYRCLQRLAQIRIPEDTGDFRLLSRRAVDALRSMRETHRYMKGMFSWIGFRQTSISYRRAPRQGGKSKWSYWRLWNFALEGITSFSTAPLKAATYIGFITAITAFVFALAIVYRTLVFGDPVRGYPSLMVVILFLGGIQLISLGVIGEYLGRMFDETKRRPLYLLNGRQASAMATRKDEIGHTGPASD